VTRVTTTNDATFIRMVEEIRIQNQRIDQAAAQPGGEARVTQALARTYGTSPARIRAEAAEHHLGLGELAIARSLARATAGSDHPLTLRQVIALRESQGGWGQVFHHLRDEGLVNERNLGQVVRHARTAARASGAPVGSGGAQAHATTRAATRGSVRAEAVPRTDAGTAAARTRPIAITTAGNRTDVVTAGTTARHGADRVAASSPGGGNDSVARGAAAGAGRGRGVAAVTITSAGNGGLAGGRPAVTSAGHGSGETGQGGAKR
jgi:hypothetical protein